MVTESFMWIVIHWLIKPSPYVNCDWVINWLIDCTESFLWFVIDWLIDWTESFMWIVIDWLIVPSRLCELWLIDWTESFMWIVID